MAALIPTLKQLWKNSKQVQSFSEEELYQYSITRMLESKDKKAEKLLKSIGVGLSNYGFFDAPDFLEFAILEKIDFDITYTFDKKFELISYPALDEDATETANCYVYAYDQRKENIRKLGKPALGLSPPLFS
jgi:hypothetical protein